MAALLARGISSFEPHLQDAAAFALGNLCADCKDGQRLVREGGGIEALVVLLAAPQAFVRKQAAWALGNVCDRSPPNRETARQAGAISALVACMDHPQVEVVREGVKAVGTLCVDEPLARVYFRQAGGLSRLQRLIAGGTEQQELTDRRLVRQAIWALGHVARGDEGSKSALREHGAVTSLVKYLHGRSAGMRDQAGFALRQLCSGDEEVDPEADESPLFGDVLGTELARGQRREKIARYARAQGQATAGAEEFRGWSSSEEEATDSDDFESSRGASSVRSAGSYSRRSSSYSHSEYSSGYDSQSDGGWTDGSRRSMSARDDESDSGYDSGSSRSSFSSRRSSASRYSHTDRSAASSRGSRGGRDRDGGSGRRRDKQPRSRGGSAGRRQGRATEAAEPTSSRRHRRSADRRPSSGRDRGDRRSSSSRGRGSPISATSDEAHVGQQDVEMQPARSASYDRRPHYMRAQELHAPPRGSGRKPRGRRGGKEPQEPNRFAHRAHEIAGSSGLGHSGAAAGGAAWQ